MVEVQWVASPEARQSKLSSHLTYYHYHVFITALSPQGLKASSADRLALSFLSLTSFYAWHPLLMRSSREDTSKGLLDLKRWLYRHDFCSRTLETIQELRTIWFCENSSHRFWDVTKKLWGEEGEGWLDAWNLGALTLFLLLHLQEYSLFQDYLEFWRSVLPFPRYDCKVWVEVLGGEGRLDSRNLGVSSRFLSLHLKKH